MALNTTSTSSWKAPNTASDRIVFVMLFLNYIAISYQDSGTSKSILLYSFVYLDDSLSKQIIRDPFY